MLCTCSIEVRALAKSSPFRFASAASRSLGPLLESDFRSDSIRVVCKDVELHGFVHYNRRMLSSGDTIP